MTKNNYGRIGSVNIERIKKRALRFFNNHRETFVEASMDADDVIQECLIRAWLISEKFSNYDDEDLIKLVNKSIGHRLIRLCKKASKKSVRFSQVEDFDAILQHVGDDMDENPFLEQDIEDAKKLLDKDQLIIVELIIDEGMSFNNVATKLNMSKRGVVFQYQKAVAILRNNLNEM